MKQLLLSLAFTLFSSIIYAQIGIGTTSPDPSSILDIQSTTKGILAPRINLNNVSNSTIDGTNTNAAGLLIYNTNASVTGGSGVGYYYWDGSTWTAMKATGSGSGSGAGWQLDGNNLNGKANDGTTFLGTTTYHSLYFKVDGDQIGRLHPNGGIALGLGASSSVNQAFAIGENASAGNTSNYAFGKGANASGSDAYAIGASSVSSQTGSYAFGAAANASATGSFAIGNQSVSSSNNTLALGNQAKATNNNSTALGFQAESNHQNAVAIGPATTSVDNSIILGNTTSTTTDAYAATKVGIGTTAPSAKLHVDGTLRYVDGNQGDGKVLTSDANGNATWQDASVVAAYSDYYLSYEFTVGNSGQVRVPFNNASVSSYNVSVSNGEATPSVNGIYRVTYSVGIYKNGGAGGGSTDVELIVYNGSSQVNASRVSLELTNGDQPVNIVKSCLVQFQGSGSIRLIVDKDNGNRNLMISENSNFNIELIRGL